MVDNTDALIHELRTHAQAVYLATDKVVADTLSQVFKDAAKEMDKQRKRIANLEAEAAKGMNKAAVMFKSRWEMDMATRYDFVCGDCGKDFDQTDITCPHCGSWGAHDTEGDLDYAKAKKRIAKLEKVAEAARNHGACGGCARIRNSRCSAKGCGIPALEQALDELESQ